MLRSNWLICLVLLLPFLLADCSGKKTGKRNYGEEAYGEDEEGAAGSRRGRGGAGGDDEDSKDVEVEVEAGQEFEPEPEPEIEVETVNAPRTREVAQPDGQKLIALKITVKNHMENLQMLVAPQRFHLETEGGVKIRPTFRELEGPMLQEGYLKDGDKVTGWVVFQSPPKKDKLYLIADLRDPPIRVPVNLGQD